MKTARTDRFAESGARREHRAAFAVVAVAAAVLCALIGEPAHAASSRAAKKVSPKAPTKARETPAAPPTRSSSSPALVSPAVASPAPAFPTVGATVEEAQGLLVETSRAALHSLLADTGIVAALPGATEIAEGLSGRVNESVLAQRRLAAALVGEDVSAAGLRLIARAAESPRLGTSRAAAMLGTQALASHLSLALGDDMPTEGDHDDGREAFLSANRDGVVSVKLRKTDTETTEGGVLVVSSDHAGVVDACPDATGALHGRLVVNTRIDAKTASGTSTGQWRMELTYEARVSDAARVAGLSIATQGSAADAVGVERGSAVDGYFVEGSSRVDLSSNAGGGFDVKRYGDQRIVRSSRSVDAAKATKFVNQQAQIGVLLSRIVLDQIEKHFRSGACVTVVLAPAIGAAGLAPGQQTSVKVDTRSTVTKEAFAAPAAVNVSAGKGSIREPGTVPATPGDVVFTAGTDGKPSTILATSTSRRGIGTQSLVLGGPAPLEVDSMLDVFSATGRKCGGPGGTWHLNLTASFEGARFSGRLVVELDPASLRGTFALTGSTTGGGVAIEQRGSGTAAFVRNPDGTAALILEGAAWTGGPAGARSVSVRAGTGACS